MLVNARHVKTLPVRKPTSRTRPGWRARRARAGPRIVRPARTDPSAASRHPRPDRFDPRRGREIQRLEKLLEDACIKLSAVATDILGVSRAMPEARIRGEHDSTALAEWPSRLRSKIPSHIETLDGRFTIALPADVHLRLIDQHTEADMTRFPTARHLASWPDFRR